MLNQATLIRAGVNIVQKNASTRVGELEKCLSAMFVINKHTRTLKIKVDQKAKNSFAVSHVRLSGGTLLCTSAKGMVTGTVAQHRIGKYCLAQKYQNCVKDVGPKI